MIRIPRAPLLLAVVGLLPLVWGALTQLFAPLADFGLHWIGPRFLGPYVSLSYGQIILAFMSGVLWGFATKAEGRQGAEAYVMAVIPALWAFLFVGGGPVSSAIYLVAGFIGLLGLDWIFWQRGLAPVWWIQLRAAMTIAVVACLMVPVFA